MWDVLQKGETAVQKGKTALRARGRGEGLTGKTSAVITECRCAVAEVRHERAAKEGTEAAKRRQEQPLNKRRCVNSMSEMGDRWAAGRNNRLTNSWRVVLRIYDAMCAGVNG
jgi:hypothetical protein